MARRSTPTNPLEGLTPDQLAAIAAIMAPTTPATTRKRSSAAVPAADVWTCQKAWKGQTPSQGLLWAAQEAGILRFVIDGKVVAKVDKLTLSKAIGKSRGMRVEIA